MARKKTEHQIYESRTSPERVQRIMRERGISEQQAKKVARGHGITTPEHGKEEYLGLFGEGDKARAMYETRSGQRAKHMLVAANRNNQEVTIEVYDKNHTARPLILVVPGYGSRIPASWLLYDKANPDRIDGLANLKKWLEKQQMPQGGQHDPSPGYFPEGITKIRVSRFRERYHPLTKELR